ncbi:hypothetical protein N0V91_003114 [Didymella pomorum]|uniref:AAA+ ATPase domain-containing protein n=1 Tax=Didymella pomorum TaxID=749634 RepID=A0A9W8ZIX1_9PLEO|nr:hypothetical protein N0V91_003114 [Didymella pomorum]
MGEPVEIYEPFAILVHHWSELKKFREHFDPAKVTEDTKDCLLNDTYEDLGLLLAYLDGEMGPKVLAEQQRWREDVPKASFEMLWLLLKPGTDVYFDNGDGTKSAAVISYVSILGDTEQDRKYVVKYWQMHGSGFNVQPYEHQRTYLRFHGEKPITELHIFPQRFLKDDSKLFQNQVDQGSLYCSLLQKKCMYFDGKGESIPAQSDWPHEQLRRPIVARTYKGNVMLDPERQNSALASSILPPNPPALVEAVDLKPSGLRFCTCTRCSKIDSELTRRAKFAGYQKVALDKGEKLTDHQLSLCPRTIWGFVLDIRDWRLLSLDGFREAHWSTDLIDSLVLKDSYKMMLQHLCRMFVQKKAAATVGPRPKDDSEATTITPWAADFVENKGKGLIFLLHGKPGVGKTYTAECIADHVKRPLLSISCADIGVDPSNVEENLRYWLDLGRRWDAIVLLDEADIYMEYRQIHDLQRNSLVASFLQAVEYYDGVLFLTTNRIGTFDEAFLSRINALYYGDFSDADRQRVWNNYFDKLEREREDIYVPESTKDYVTNKDVKALKWNGREIRNAFQVAVNLAQAEGIKDAKKRIVVKRHHIEVTVNLSSDFKAYMKSVRKKDESERARLHGNRDDSYKAPLTAAEPVEYE